MHLLLTICNLLFSYQQKTNQLVFLFSPMLLRILATKRVVQEILLLVEKVLI